MAERLCELAETQAALPGDAPLEFARDRASAILHMEFIARGEREAELAKRFGRRPEAVRDDLYGDFTELLVRLLRKAGAEAGP